MQKTRGFTLVEILVALAIISVIFASVTISTRKSNWMEMQDQSEIFRDTLLDLSDHASFKQTSFGLYFTEAGYWFLERIAITQDEETGDPIYNWVPIQNERFVSVEFEDIYIFELSIDNNPVALLDVFPSEEEQLEIGLKEIADFEIYSESFNSNGSSKTVGLEPHIYLDLNGELSNAFTLSIIEQTQDFEQPPLTYQIISDGFNRPVISRIEEDDF
ncbi:type II secretion system protein [Marinicellulosiphila megalodicopiae]|uniref:type II secretion system protein n=1 Tax=Marinicellulosiphila megalodicopiae TaxID=2724896 RepID=UPI003BAF320D